MRDLLVEETERIRLGAYEPICPLEQERQSPAEIPNVRIFKRRIWLAKEEIDAKTKVSEPLSYAVAPPGHLSGY
jgi:hypothetical protein